MFAPRNIRSYIRLLVWVGVVIGVIGYATYQARALASGPVLIVESPLNGTLLTQSLTIVQGYTKNVSAISLNDRPIFINEEGRFSEHLLLAPGYNVIQIAAQDKFNREIIEQLEIVYQ